MHTKPLPRGAQAFCNQVSTLSTQRYSRNIRNTCGHPKLISSHGAILIFAHSPGTIFSAAWSRENQTRPLNCPSIASSYHSFPTQRGRFQTTGFKNTYSYMFLVFQVTARRGDYRPLPPSLVTRSTKLKNPSEQPPKNQGAGGRKEQFLKIDCSMERDQHTWAFCCDR